LPPDESPSVWFGQARILQRGDLLRLPLDPLRLLLDQRITRILRRRRIGHSPQGSPKPRSATAATPRLPPKRNQRSLAVTPSPGA